MILIRLQIGNYKCLLSCDLTSFISPPLFITSLSLIQHHTVKSFFITNVIMYEVFGVVELCLSLWLCYHGQGPFSIHLSVIRLSPSLPMSEICLKVSMRIFLNLLLSRSKPFSLFYLSFLHQWFSPSLALSICIYLSVFLSIHCLMTRWIVEQIMRQDLLYGLHAGISRSTFPVSISIHSISGQIPISFHIWSLWW